MLIVETTEQDIIRNKGLSASTLMAATFWPELVKFMYSQIDERLALAEQSKNASTEIKASLLDRYIWTKELVSRIERFPALAVEQARELGEQNE